MSRQQQNGLVAVVQLGEQLPAIPCFMIPATIIVLSWNSRHLLESSLPPLLAQDYPEFKVVVVDNASTDGSAAYVAEQFPQVALVTNPYNLGFAAGNNVALRQLETPVAVLVNPDVVVTAGWLTALVAPLAADKTEGITGSKLYFPGGKIIQHAGGSIRGPQAFPEHYGYGEEDTGQYGQPRDVEYVIGGALALHRRVLETVGLFDEDYFLYFEDADFCERVRRAGFRVRYVPDAVAIHQESATTGKGSEQYLERFHTSRWRFLLKHTSLEKIIEKTLPAEQEWTAAHLPPYLASRIYRNVQRQWVSIWQEREREGLPPVPEEAQQHLFMRLDALRQHLLKSPPLPTGQVQPSPFRSSIPLLGFLVARLRQGWNNVAGRMYVDTLVTQQNLFNRQLAERVEQQEKRLEKQDQIQSKQIASLNLVRQELSRLNHQLAHVGHIVDRLEEKGG